MKSRFPALCAALNDCWTPALQAAGFTPPPERFNRTHARYEFTRSSPAGCQTVAVLFRRRRPAEFSVQLYVAPPEGLPSLEAGGGELVIGTLTPRPRRWPFPLATFDAEPTVLQRALSRPGVSVEHVVDTAIALLPEIEAWWRSRQPTRHIVTGVLRYPGNQAR